MILSQLAVLIICLIVSMGENLWSWRNSVLVPKTILCFFLGLCLALSLPIQSNPIQSSPVQSNPIQSSMCVCLCLCLCVLCVHAYNIPDQKTMADTDTALLWIAGIYEPPFLILLQWTYPGCEDCLLSGVCSLQVKQGTVYTCTSIFCGPKL